ncbi:VRR-NUC domain-containing protein [Helicobacter aurati]|uniref:VRR-NUC domain-containing protein n=1 Tax=Helicobacter aurati TaxID=137778 RepID=A0A3D8IYP5_9HELI|nr:VRR-NUC domain-containing protein [Helicobacter aurati]RDU70392.1 VRR-NUC domain-containing protein [Helicobacter aurati]
MKKQNREHKLQVSIFSWAEYNLKKYPELKLLNSSLNGIFIKNKLASYNAKLSGMKKGYPDIFLPVARCGYHGLFIELKVNQDKDLNISKGRLTKEQEQWLKDLNNQGYLAVVSYGYESTIKLIENYLRGKLSDETLH